jgi:peptide/nickel transport system permease protein
VSAEPALRGLPPLQRRIALPRLARGRGGNRALSAGLVIVGALALAAVLAPVLAPRSPTAQDITNALAAPGASGHLLGTDHLGRDVLSRLLYGARTDLFVGIGAVIAPLVLGTALGAIAGYAGGWVDTVIMRIVDLVFAFPIMVLLIALVFVLQPGVVSIMVAVTVVDWVAYARLTRAQVIGQKGLDYVLAARIGGLSSLRVLGRHILPNVIAQNVVYAVSDAVLVILAITTLGFLGLGVPPPAADWGGMISDAQPYVDAQWWLAVFPGVAILVTGLGLSLVGDGLATRLDRR